MLPMSDETAETLLSRIPVEKRPDSWWLVRRDATPVAGNNGGWIALLSEMRSTRLLSRLIAWLRLTRLLDWWADFLTKHRGKVADYLPEGPGPHRFP